MKTYLWITVEIVDSKRMSFTIEDTGDGEKNWQEINRIIAEVYGLSVTVVGIKSFQA